MNLLMLATLRDMDGKIRYILGAQIDVSNLIPDSTELETADPLGNPQVGFVGTNAASGSAHVKDALRSLHEMPDGQGGREHRQWSAGTSLGESRPDLRTINNHDRRPRILLRDASSDSLPSNDPGGWVNNRLGGFYQNVSHVPCRPPFVSLTSP